MYVRGSAIKKELTGRPKRKKRRIGREDEYNF